MSFTNSTEHYGLPQWIGSNTPTFLVDFNNAFLAIDNAIYARTTNAENLQSQITAAVDTIQILQDRIHAFDEDFGTLPAEVAGLKTQVQILSTHEQEHDVDIRNIRKEIENIQTTASQLSQNMTEMFRVRDAALETYKEQVNSDFEEIRGEVAGNSADFALLKNGLYEGDATEENPLGERKFALRSEIFSRSGLLKLDPDLTKMNPQITRVSYQQGDSAAHIIIEGPITRGVYCAEITMQAAYSGVATNITYPILFSSNNNNVKGTGVILKQSLLSTSFLKISALFILTTNQGDAGYVKFTSVGQPDTDFDKDYSNIVYNVFRLAIGM